MTNKYTSGIICQIDSYNSTYHSINYWISDDGTTTTKLRVYSGKGLNGANFSSVDDLNVGDIVVIKGTLDEYNSVPEYNYSSQIVSRVIPETPASIVGYSLVTDPSNLLTGDEIIIVGTATSNNTTTYYSMVGITSNVMTTTTLTESSGNLIANNSTMKFTIIKDSTGYRFKNSDNKYLATASSSQNYCALQDGTPTIISLFDISCSDNTMSIVGVSGTGAYDRRTLLFNLNSSGASPRFAFYKSSSSISGGEISIYKKATQVNADSWSQTFLDSTSDGQVCNVNNWSTLVSTYKALDEEVQNEIINVEANASEFYSVRAQAMARYDFFMSDSRFNQGEHFIVGRASSSNARPFLSLLATEQNKSLFIVILCSIIGVSSIGCYYFMKFKKREENNV